MARWLGIACLNTRIKFKIHKIALRFHTVRNTESLNKLLSANEITAATIIILACFSCWCAGSISTVILTRRHEAVHTEFVSRAYMSSASCAARSFCCCSYQAQHWEYNNYYNQVLLTANYSKQTQCSLNLFAWFNFRPLFYLILCKVRIYPVRTMHL